jgi:hypothetical protein
MKRWFWVQSRKIAVICPYDLMGLKKVASMNASTAFWILMQLRAQAFRKRFEAGDPQLRPDGTSALVYMGHRTIQNFGNASI